MPLGCEFYIKCDLSDEIHVLSCIWSWGRLALWVAGHRYCARHPLQMIRIEVKATNLVPGVEENQIYGFSRRNNLPYIGRLKTIASQARLQWHLQRPRINLVTATRPGRCHDMCRRRRRWWLIALVKQSEKPLKLLFKVPLLSTLLWASGVVKQVRIYYPWQYDCRVSQTIYLRLRSPCTPRH